MVLRKKRKITIADRRRALRLRKELDVFADKIMSKKVAFLRNDLRRINLKLKKLDEERAKRLRKK